MRHGAQGWPATALRLMKHHRVRYRSVSLSCAAIFIKVASAPCTTNPCAPCTGVKPVSVHQNLCAVPSWDTTYTLQERSDFCIRRRAGLG